MSFFWLRAADCRPYGDAVGRCEVVGRDLAPAVFIAYGDADSQRRRPVFALSVTATPCHLSRRERHIRSVRKHRNNHAASRGSVTAKKQAVTSSGERVHSSASHQRTVCTKAAAICRTR